MFIVDDQCACASGISIVMKLRMNLSSLTTFTAFNNLEYCQNFNVLHFRICIWRYSVKNVKCHSTERDGRI